jgi:hypothetical protein
MFQIIHADGENTLIEREWKVNAKRLTTTLLPTIRTGASQQGTKREMKVEIDVIC